MGGRKLTPRKRFGPPPSSVEPTLNPAQHLAAETVDGPLLVIAGAGTGKTHTLVHRLVSLVETGVSPQSILLLTFTRRAAEEMIARASAVLGGRYDSVAGGTFHSFANLMLRRYGRAAGLEPDFTILDQADTFEILSWIRTDLGLSARGRGFPRRETIAAILSKAVNKQAPIEEVVAEEYPQFLSEVQHLTRIAGLYDLYKKKRYLVDFDDLLVLLIRLLEEAPEPTARIRDRYRYIMVDEYQDTNVLQARITHLLAGDRKNVMVVGDDAQSIYGFRGACHRNLFDFTTAFRGVRLITLEENYRSTQPVLEVANALMAQMSRAFQKRLFTKRRGGEIPLLVQASDEEEQAAFVATEVERLHREGAPLAHMAVLFRASRHAFALELELQRRAVPYVKYGGFRFMESAHIKDVLAHLRLVAQPSDDLSLRRVLLLREGIGKTAVRRIQEAVSGKPLVPSLRSYPARGKVRKSLEEVADLVASLEATRASPADCLEKAVEAYDPLLKLRFDDWPRRRRDLSTLVDLCRRYRSLSSMLSDLALEPPTTSSRDTLAARSAEDRLVLSTMHSAKGLEWKSVFVIQAREGYIPMVSRFDEEEAGEELDEELRLLYVAVTRAKDDLYLVWPLETARGGFTIPMPSRFIVGLPENLLARREASQLIR